MGKALYRQYRSTSFDEVIGQDHITTTLKNSLSSGSVGHAYLLTGPRGVGKTSVARILAFAVNGLPYKPDNIHLDIIEIDAASNRRIDEIRSLRERVHIAPTSGKYKVYIIDEVHMLTREAFNALLKTLEEPPAHVIFILATTEVHKLPDTIISRCITFTFQPIRDEDIVAHLKHIAGSEGFKITSEALALLAKHGDGSFRDSISLLDQVKSTSSEVTAADIELALGLASQESVTSILSAVSQGDPKALSSALQEAYAHGANETNLSKQIAGQVRSDLLSKKPFLSSDDALSLLANLLEVSASSKPRAKLELCLLDQLFRSAPLASSTPIPDKLTVAAASDPPEETGGTPETVVAEASLTFNEPPATAEKKTPAADVTEKTNQKTPAAKAPQAEVTIEADQEVWNGVLRKLKTQNNTLYGIARMAQAELVGNTLSLCFKFPFHFRQVNQPKNKSIITGIIETMGHKNIAVVVTEKKGKAATQAKTAEEDEALSNITNIFGDSEVLES